MIRFLIPEPKDRRSGGTLYDLQMVDALLEKGCDVKTDWVSENKGIQNLLTDLDKDDLLIIDGLVFHQNYKDSSLLDGFEKIYLTHLPFWLEPGIDAGESKKRKFREVSFMLRCKRVITTSSFIQNRIIECGISEAKTIVINPKIIDQSLQKQNYKKMPEELLVVGAVHFGKGLDLLIEALGHLDQNDWKLKIAGIFDSDDGYFKRLNQAIGRHNLASKIEFLGECNPNKIIELYQNSDLLIHPSRFESYGMVISEAIRHGLPVIASDAGALPAVYNSTPVRFFKTENVSSLAAILQSILNPKGYLALAQKFENYIFKGGSKDNFNDKINKLITHLQ